MGVGDILRKVLGLFHSRLFLVVLASVMFVVGTTLIFLPYDKLLTKKSITTSKPYTESSVPYQQKVSEQVYAPSYVTPSVPPAPVKKEILPVEPSDLRAIASHGRRSGGGGGSSGDGGAAPSDADAPSEEDVEEQEEVPVECSDDNPCADGQSCADGQCIAVDAEGEEVICDDETLCEEGFNCVDNQCVAVEPSPVDAEAKKGFNEICDRQGGFDQCEEGLFCSDTDEGSRCMKGVKGLSCENDDECVLNAVCVQKEGDETKRCYGGDAFLCGVVTPDAGPVLYEDACAIGFECVEERDPEDNQVWICRNSSCVNDSSCDEGFVCSQLGEDGRRVCVEQKVACKKLGQVPCTENSDELVCYKNKIHAQFDSLCLSKECVVVLENFVGEEIVECDDDDNCPDGKSCLGDYCVNDNFRSDFDNVCKPEFDLAEGKEIVKDEEEVEVVEEDEEFPSGDETKNIILIGLTDIDSKIRNLNKRYGTVCEFVNAKKEVNNIREMVVGSECGEDAQCLLGQTCESGVCAGEEGQCVSIEQIIGGEKEINVCESDDDCDGSNICRRTAHNGNKICMPPSDGADFCERDVECWSNTCIEQENVCGGARLMRCNLDVDCNVGFNCIDNVCIEPVQNDKDKDGVSDEVDNCVGVANRNVGQPNGSSKQPDEDTDGVGDACDCIAAGMGLEIGGDCPENTECKAGVNRKNELEFICQLPEEVVDLNLSEGERCNKEEDCIEGLVCKRENRGIGILVCTSPSGLDGYCDENTDCSAGLGCTNEFVCKGLDGSSCESDSNCKNELVCVDGQCSGRVGYGQICENNLECTAGNRCRKETSVAVSTKCLSPSEDGTYCGNDLDCGSQKCIKLGDAEGGICAIRCEARDDCSGERFLSKVRVENNYYSEDGDFYCVGGLSRINNEGREEQIKVCQKVSEQCTVNDEGIVGFSGSLAEGFYPMRNTCRNVEGAFKAVEFSCVDSRLEERFVDCSVGERCMNGSCQPTMCRDNNDCNVPGMLCQEGKCIWGREDGEACETGVECKSTICRKLSADSEKVCAQKATDGEFCLFDSSCDTLACVESKCVSKCDGDNNCEGNEFCAIQRTGDVEINVCAPKCVDSDGEDSNVKGTTSGVGKGIWTGYNEVGDSCRIEVLTLTNNCNEGDENCRVLEGICQDNYFTTKSITCDSGMCQDGVCVERVIPKVTVFDKVGGDVGEIDELLVSLNERYKDNAEFINIKKNFAILRKKALGFECSSDVQCWNDLTCQGGVCGGVVKDAVLEKVCNDVIDNDEDGDVDCNDVDCAGNEACVEEVVAEERVEPGEVRGFGIHTLGIGESATFMVGGQEHTLRIENFDSEAGTVDVWIESEPITLTLNVGEVTAVDLDNDENNDVEIKVASIGEVVSIGIRVLEVEGDKEEAEELPEDAEEENEEEAEPQDVLKSQGEVCESNNQCQGGLCRVSPADGTNKCAISCASDNECLNSQFCFVFENEGYCLGKMLIEGVCENNNQCLSGICEAGLCREVVAENVVVIPEGAKYWCRGNCNEQVIGLMEKLNQVSLIIEESGVESLKIVKNELISYITSANRGEFGVVGVREEVVEDCIPSDEVCDGVDNNCDGYVDSTVVEWSEAHPGQPEAFAGVCLTNEQCGAVDSTCGANSYCYETPQHSKGALCVCDAGWIGCAGSCDTNIKDDVNNCGACGHFCAQGESCVNSICLQLEDAEEDEVIVDGSAGGACREGWPQCEQGLVCLGGVCEDTRGTLFNQCREDGGCNGSLLCINNICRQPLGERDICENVNDEPSNWCMEGLKCRKENPDSDYLCLKLGVSGYCDVDSDCESGECGVDAEGKNLCVIVSAEEGDGAEPQEALKSQGELCETDDQCQDGLCGAGLDGRQCAEGLSCEGGVCEGVVCSPGFCLNMQNSAFWCKGNCETQLKNLMLFKFRVNDELFRVNDEINNAWLSVVEHMGVVNGGRFGLMVEEELPENEEEEENQGFEILSTNPNSNLGCFGETDGGVDVFVVGTVSTGMRRSPSIVRDFCIDGEILSEHSCFEGTYLRTQVRCENGCSIGVCNQ